MNHPRPHLTKDELRYFGKNACRALWQMRPKDLIRIYVHKNLEKEFSDLLQWCSIHRKAYHLVGDQDLEKLTDSIHHQGICLVAKEKKSLSLQDFLRETRSDSRTQALYLDGVQNPHNLGAILRTAAHFGTRYVIGQKGALPRLSPAANRTAEGGAEAVSLVRVEDGPAAIQELKTKGFKIYAADIDQQSYPIYELQFAPRCIFVMGGEVEGVSTALCSAADHLIKIPGTGAVESLNVSVAAALLLGESYRQSLRTGERRIARK